MAERHREKEKKGTNSEIYLLRENTAALKEQLYVPEPSHVLQEESSTIPDRPPSNDISNSDPKDRSHQEDIQNSKLAHLCSKERVSLFNYLINFVYQATDNNSSLEQEPDLSKV